MLTNAPRVAVAKYVPDLHRMEPRNIGVVVWLNGRIESRFIGVDRHGKVNVPSFAKSDAHAYREWIESWHIQFTKKEIRLENSGKLVDRKSPEFVDALIQKSKHAFMLTDAAHILGHVPPSRLGEVADEMFARLVEREPTPGSERTVYAELKSRFSEILSHSKLKEFDYHRATHDLLGKIGGVYKYFDVDYAFGVDKSVTTVFRRVVPGHGNTSNVAALIFQGLSTYDKGSVKYRCGAIYINSDGSQEAQNDLDMLRQFSNLIEVSDTEKARVEVERFVGLNSNGPI